MRFKRSSLLTKILILVLVVYATVTLVSLQGQVTEKEAEAQALQSSIEAAKQENLRLEQAIDALGTDASVEDIARQKLGWASEGEIVFYDMGNK
jgi:cell division protein FtsL